MQSILKYKWYIIAAGLVIILYKYWSKIKSFFLTANSMSGTLGMRNNNPLNIRYNSGNHWQGLTGENKGFCTFKSRVYGYRAAFVNLQTYNVAGKDTIREIINKWAPATENNTAAYISRCIESHRLFAGCKEQL